MRDEIIEIKQVANFGPYKLYLFDNHTERVRIFKNDIQVEHGKISETFRVIANLLDINEQNTLASTWKDTYRLGKKIIEKINSIEHLVS